MASRTLRRRASYRALGRHSQHHSRPLLRILVVVLVGFVMLTSGASAGTLFFYGQNLPKMSLQGKMQFQNTVIEDSFGHKIYDLADLSNKNRGRRVIKPLQWPSETEAHIQAHHEDWLTAVNNRGIPTIMQDATIATEDATFYSNPGFDPFSIVRAAYDNWVKGEIVSGASTITQQLVRKYMNLTGHTLSRKAEEVVLAAELTQKYPKSKILWYYLNSVPYGNLSVGAEAAAETYFHEHVWNLDLAQSALLAGLPEAPSVYDPVTSRANAMARMHYVLYLMCLHGYIRARTCSNPDPPQIQAAMQEAHKWVFTPPVVSNKYPHFVAYAINQLQQLSATVPDLKNRLYDGLRVVTTLDPRLQDQAQRIVSGQIAGLTNLNVTDGALVSMDVRPSCPGCVLAMVGSANYRAAGGQINMADSPRQPGSSFKPFNYIYGFMHGLAPGTTVYDGPIAIPDTGNAADGGVYAPENYDHIWHGGVTLRVALDNSLNIPAIKVEQFNASVAGTPGLQAIANQAQTMGVTSFWKDNPNCCGWALTLGGMEHGMRLVEETSAYGTFANNGATLPPVAIKHVYDRTTGKLLYDFRGKYGPKRKQVMDPAYAYVMNNVLSDNNSRCTPAVCEFGLTSPLYLGRTAAAKTGTTENFTDNWTMGYTPDIVTGVWVGNVDNSQMVGTTGVTGAAPIWHDYMLKAFSLLNLPPKDFVEPPSVYGGTLCIVPGAAYSESSMGYDIYAGRTPFCSVGTVTSAIPVQPSTQYPQSQPVVPQPAAPQPAAPQPVAPQQPAPVAAPTVTPAPAAPPPTQLQPTVAPAAPVAPAPVQAQPTSPPSNIPGVQPSG